MVLVDLAVQGRPDCLEALGDLGLLAGRLALEVRLALEPPSLLSPQLVREGLLKVRLPLSRLSRRWLQWNPLRLLCLSRLSRQWLR